MGREGWHPKGLRPKRKPGIVRKRGSSELEQEQTLVGIVSWNVIAAPLEILVEKIQLALVG